MTTRLALALSLTLTLGTALAQETPSKEDRVRELVDLVSGGNFAEKAMEAMRLQFEELPPDTLPPGFVEKFMEMADPTELQKIVVDIWAENVSDEAINAGLEFFRSEEGKLFAEAQASIEGKILLASQSWGQEMAMKVMFEGGLMEEMMAEMGEEMPDFEAEDMPEFEEDDIAGNETSAIGALRSIATAEAQFQAAAIIDVDGDGKGEYGFLSELGGQCAYRTPEGISTEPCSPAFIRSKIAKPAYEGEGISTYNGYHLLVYLPSAAGKALADPGIVSAGSPEHADAQENRWIAYAWPVEAGVTGERAFVVNQDGEVFASANLDFQDYSGRDNIPAPGAALVTLKEGQNGANLEGKLVTGMMAGDENIWLPAGE